MEGNCLPVDNSTIQEKEIEQIKATYPGNVKVISGIGAFTYVVTIHHEPNLHCKFQLTDNYPDTSPIISIRCSVLDADLSSRLITHLQNEAATKLGHAMLVELMNSCNQWLNENNIDLSDNVPEVGEKSKYKKHSGKSKNSKKSKSENEVDDSNKKKPPMKTAADVIKRIQWDKGIDKNDFIVGYMDRIVGLVEKAFTAFTWEDLASVDMFSLAIPQHRIQYFKYKTEKVWDKTDRLDNVFGSTGSKITIVDTIKIYEDKIVTKPQPEEESTVEHQQSETMETTADIDDVSDNELEVDIDQTAEYLRSDMASGSRQRFRCNYFTTIQLTDVNTVRNLIRVQNEILDRHPKYEEYKTPSNGFHLTLNVLNLESASDVGLCADTLEKVTPELKSLALATKPMIIEGLDNFDTCKVIFAKMSLSAELRNLVDKINKSLYDAGIQVDMSSFKPHITLFNVKWSVFKSRQWVREEVMLTNYATFQFGSQAIDNIQVCKMGTLPDDPGCTRFYRSIFYLSDF